MHQLVLLLLFLFLPDATFSTPAAGPSCNRQCGSTTVPYPFGFSGGGGGGECPILLACNATTSTALLPRSTAAAPYPVLSFNSTASTFLVSLAPSCGRGVAEVRSALDGAGYGVTSRTGLFLRGGGGGGGGPATTGSNSSSCNVPSGVMSAILHTAQCGGGNDTSWTCVLSAPPAPGSPAAASGEGQFLRWDSVAGAGCQDALTSAVYAYTAQGVPSIEFGIAEMGWWLNGSCNSGGGGGQCALNATCHDVQTPDGAWGHRCTCADGMSGDGFAAGDGCHYDSAPSGECAVLVLPTVINYISLLSFSSR
ncbi:unnamed protein product [Miscanthus lutarioriparius]|uniref:Wall-associated receptor kinase galacturonan-binding domain-containing protein n=1 Tax=Miscanthus lutarioriparius TaxID=422564 RepID=A0A811RHW3_9POAL|nr:unnamed protein product [Miscanthus lutarioriparius]